MSINKRIEWLDSLRGISALLVFTLHFWLRVREKIPNNFIYKIIDNIVFGYLDFGKIGVVTFFLISGYVIPISLVKNTVKKFSISRFFRLYPAYWAVIGLSILLNPFEISQLPKLLANLTMFQKFIGFEDLVGVFWTLQIELVFYILCIVLHLYKKLYKPQNVILVYCLIVVSFIASFFRFYLEKKIPVALFLALCVMFLGMCYRYFEEDNKHTFINRSKSLTFVFIIFLLPITILAYSVDLGNEETWYRYFNSYIFAIILFAFFMNFEMSNSFLTFIGKISYSFYLVHTVIMDYLLLSFPDISIYTFFIVSIGLIGVISIMSYKYVELFFLNVGRNMINKLNIEKDTYN